MKKKNILMIALSLCLIAVIAVSGTLAYFTDTTEKKTNTFTMGQVKINLTEITDDSSEDASSSSGGIEYFNVMPGDTRSKIVTVTRDAVSADCYVAVLVQAVPDETKGIPATADLLKLVSDEVDPNTWLVRYLNKDRAVLQPGAEGAIPKEAVYALYVLNTKLTEQDNQETLISKITFPAETWDNSYASASFDLKISAYAVQSDNFPVENGMDDAADWFATNLDTIEDNTLPETKQ